MEAKPVFVDGSGRRSRIARWCGIAMAAVVLGYLGMIGVAVFAADRTPLSVPSWPAADPAAVHPSPTPAQTRKHAVTKRPVKRTTRHPGKVRPSPHRTS